MSDWAPGMRFVVTVGIGVEPYEVSGDEAIQGREKTEFPHSHSPRAIERSALVKQFDAWLPIIFSRDNVRMTRGRRPNLELEPTRSLQTQRAFRERKRKHLADLEAAYANLKEENTSFRQALGIPCEDAGIPSESQQTASSSSSNVTDECSSKRKRLSSTASNATASNVPTSEPSPPATVATVMSNAALAALADIDVPALLSNMSTQDRQQLENIARQLQGKITLLQQHLAGLRTAIAHGHNRVNNVAVAAAMGFEGCRRTPSSHTHMRAPLTPQVSDAASRYGVLPSTTNSPMNGSLLNDSPAMIADGPSPSLYHSPAMPYLSGARGVPAIGPTAAADSVALSAFPGRGPTGRSQSLHMGYAPAIDAVNGFLPCRQAGLYAHHPHPPSQADDVQGHYLSSIYQQAAHTEMMSPPVATWIHQTPHPHQYPNQDRQHQPQNLLQPPPPSQQQQGLQYLRTPADDQYASYLLRAQPHTRHSGQNVAHTSSSSGGSIQPSPEQQDIKQRSAPQLLHRDIGSAPTVTSQQLPRLDHAEMQGPAADERRAKREQSPPLLSSLGDAVDSEGEGAMDSRAGSEGDVDGGRSCDLPPIHCSASTGGACCKKADSAL
ncbi:hypothetical protein K437DRAFT_262010 [Tilletiaria anomala UBC 951]|uniref:BZIP domain-containing protein n=1 Tax=Tilletiaria anomala (strain ATCC 24038 / CBS 436.72 / UBC 951) TaxID=1037660 RepID=A0A066W892_TILAU|nr:uncharacterized protein K437DRAFT_262010 [Tilletiaria anomala UBC 951]KDN49941.1 hypothetical protein K437DRAFT_262010 [Tilletiaria anomala UBC 951]